MGRTKGIRYGPRPIDLDILFYGKYRISSETLAVPHERIFERPFVMAPLVDLLGSDIDNDTVLDAFMFKDKGLFGAWEELGGESLIGKDGLRRVLPVGDRLWDWSKKTSVMDTYELPEIEGKMLSVDTFYSEVASEAIKKGAHIVNDVSGGKLDSDMLRVVAGLNVPYITMHMRGDPSTMQNSENLKYDDVCKEVGDESVNECGKVLSYVECGLAKKRRGVHRSTFVNGAFQEEVIGSSLWSVSAIEERCGLLLTLRLLFLGGANIVVVHMFEIMQML
ncbi:folate synthesis bifunctional protein, mitochondrial isoform X1 [Tanacetum coccineum]|uniref:2-amino-4-hydroxy-6-hydroxymethyldihydropteridine diphosphokinase n=1 Tax=Tanacetum coccineum TaxID=301880 RepID=A0ABQ5FDQ8_9ASTR